LPNPSLFNLFAPLTCFGVGLALTLALEVPTAIETVDKVVFNTGVGEDVVVGVVGVGLGGVTAVADVTGIGAQVAGFDQVEPLDGVGVKILSEKVAVGVVVGTTTEAGGV